ncbi:MAG: methyltransferase, partial [Acidobacteriaceae bacterium]|nr:methyltransferase [Acidobacteriaceae bacterium]
MIGLDKDPAALDIAREKLTSEGNQDFPEITLMHGSFADIANGQGPKTIDGILADIGVSSLQ